MIRLILLDIDGTLTNTQKIITPGTREALMKAQDMGIRLAIASGRADQGLYRFADMLDMRKHHGLFVAFNGAKVVDCQTQEILYHHPMTADEAKAVLRHIRNFEVHPMIARGEYMHTDNVFAGMIHRSIGGEIFNVVEAESRGNGFILCEHRDIAEYIDFPVEKILTYGEPEYMQEHWQELREPFADTLSCMFTAPFYYEFTAKGIDKAAAVDSALTKLGFGKEDMIAFGDAQNDISMLEYAGIGVAMGNAVDEVKAIADEVTADNNHDGIAESLYRHIPELA